MDDVVPSCGSVSPSTSPKLAEPLAAGWAAGVAIGAGAFTWLVSETVVAGKLVVLVGWPIPNIK